MAATNTFGREYTYAAPGGTNVGKLESASMLRTVSHELTHYMAEAAQTEFSALQDFMVQRLSQWEGHSIQDLVEGKMATAEQAGHPITAQEALEEVVADGCEMMLRDSKAVQQLAEENRTLFEKVRDWMKKFFESLRKAFECARLPQGQRNPEQGRALGMMKQHGAVLAKGWLLGMQFAVMLESGEYFTAAKRANALSLRIRDAFRAKGIPFLTESVTNQQFVLLDKRQQDYFAEKYSFEKMGTTDRGDIIRFLNVVLDEHREIVHAVAGDPRRPSASR